MHAIKYQHCQPYQQQQQQTAFVIYCLSSDPQPATGKLLPALSTCQRATASQTCTAVKVARQKATIATLLLLLQDLRHAHMYLWVPNLEAVYNSNTSAFLDAFSDYITIRLYDYDVEVEGTPWDGDDFFGNGTLVKEYMPAPGSYSDVVRLMLLHKYGGLWMDNDVVLYNDVTHLLATSYQFVMRWM